MSDFAVTVGPESCAGGTNHDVGGHMGGVNLREFCVERGELLRGSRRLTFAVAFAWMGDIRQ
jgi:hypothetical protein